MSLSVTSIGDNQQSPGILAETYLPDQLIIRGPERTDSATVTGGADLVRGSLLGQVLIVAGSAVAGTNTGNGTISAITLGAKAKVGAYTIRFTGATTYTVVNPAGVQLTPGVAAGAYTDAELNFTFTAGGTAMVAGDTFTITNTAGSGSYKLSATAATDGSQNPVAVLLDAALCATNAADQVAPIALMGEFNSNAMTFGTGWTAATAKAALPPYLQIKIAAADLTATDPS